MRYAPLIARLLLPCSVHWPGQPPTPSSRPGPSRCSRPGRWQLPTLRPPVADTGIFSPTALPAGQRDPAAPTGAPGTGVLAAAGGLQHPGHARHRRPAPHRHRDRSATPTTRPIPSGSSGCSWTRICSGPGAPARCSLPRRAASAARDSKAVSRSTRSASAAGRPVDASRDGAAGTKARPKTARPWRSDSCSRCTLPRSGPGWTTP